MDNFEKAPEKSKSRVLVVANRLPITIAMNENGDFDFKIASGGLVSGLYSLSKSIEFQWIGWTGTEIHRNDQDMIRRRLATDFNAIPVYLSKELAEKYYSGFSNSVLWPLLHGMPFKAQFNESWTAAYREVNEIFADHIMPLVEDGDLIWVHDYHLLLLPGVLRKRLEKRRNVRVGFFLHTAFPREDSFSILPFREAICDGLLSCDLVGFHVREYVDIFLDSAEKALPDIQRSPSDLHYKGRKLIVKDFPIGINHDDFKQSIASKATQKEIKQLRLTFADRKIILGVDRLDYIKGIPQKLIAFDTLLKDHPEWIGKAVLVQIAVPTRSDVEDYRCLRKEVEELVGKINGKHGTLTYTPIQYLYRSVEPACLHALYAEADLCVVSSIHDGLNLVSYEYVACQTRRSGVLLLSQYAGAAKLLPSAVSFNPWDTPRFADAIHMALNMPLEERQKRLSEASETVETRTILQWGLSFLDELRSSSLDDEAAME